MAYTEIKSITLENAQALGRFHMDVAKDRINVISGPNNEGKSILFKIISVCMCYDYIEADRLHELIMWDKEYATILIVFDDGSNGGAMIYPKSVTYFYKPTKDSKITAYNRPHPEFVKRAGFLVSEEFRFTPNILDTVQAKLLADRKLKQNVEFVNMLVSHEKLDMLEENTNKFERVVSLSIRDLDKKIHDVEMQLSTLSFIDVFHLEEQIGLVEFLSDITYKMIDVHDIMEELYYVENRDYTDLIDISEVAIKLENLLDIDLTYSEEVNPEIFRILELAGALYEVCNIIDSIEIVKFNPEIFKILEIVDILYKVYYSVPEYIRGVDYTSLIRTADIASMLETMVGDITEIENNNKQINKLDNEIKELRELMSEYTIVEGCPIYGKIYRDGENCIPYDN